jgi:hypothetical protein
MAKKKITAQNERYLNHISSGLEAKSDKSTRKEEGQGGYTDDFKYAKN